MNSRRGRFSAAGPTAGQNQPAETLFMLLFSLARQDWLHGEETQAASGLIVLACEILEIVAKFCSLL